MKVLVTCPPMIGVQDQLGDALSAAGFETDFAEVVQTLSEDELKSLVPKYDGWIIGDDPATRDVLAAGRRGSLRAAVKWGVGVDNVDFDACKDLGIAVTHTPGMFGHEVADIAMGYVIGLARHTFRIDREIRGGGWPKYRGISLLGKRIGLIGCGDIGFQVLRRLAVAGCQTYVYDPYVSAGKIAGLEAEVQAWPAGLEECDFVVFTCALTQQTRQMFNRDVISTLKDGCRVVNVSRGGLIEQAALLSALESGKLSGAALDVFEVEPLDDEGLRKMDNCIFGSHNASNTQDAVLRTSHLAIEKLAAALEG